MLYPQFNPTAPFKYYVTQTIGRDVYEWYLDSDMTIDDFRAMFDSLNDVPESKFEVCRSQDGKFFCLELSHDRELMTFVKKYNESIKPIKYEVLGFDRDTGRGNYGMGTFDTLEDVRKFIEKEREEDGEDAPIMMVGEATSSMTYTFLDKIDEEIVRSWGIVGV